MLTREQWNAMSPQAQWDLVLSLMDEVAAIEAAKFDAQVIPPDVPQRPKLNAPPNLLMMYGDNEKS